jgi:hypothetical protein
MNMPNFSQEKSAMQTKPNGERSTRPTVHAPIDGNAFSIIGAVQAAMENAGMSQETIDEMLDQAFATRSYLKLLAICMEYVIFDL